VLGGGGWCCARWLFELDAQLIPTPKHTNLVNLYESA
jgi:hypothetical protein